MTVLSEKQDMRGVIVKLFPWLAGFVAVASAKGKGLAIRAAGGLLHLAGGPEDPAVHRVGDIADGGTFAAASPPATLIHVHPDGSAWIITLTAGMVPVTAVVAPAPGPVPAPSTTPGQIVATAATGSEKVTCG